MNTESILFKFKMDIGGLENEVIVESMSCSVVGRSTWMPLTSYYLTSTVHSLYEANNFLSVLTVHCAIKRVWRDNNNRTRFRSKPTSENTDFPFFFVCSTACSLHAMLCMPFLYSDRALYLFPLAYFALLRYLLLDFLRKVIFSLFCIDCYPNTRKHCLPGQ